MQKKVLSVEDLCGFGKCSMSLSLPIISVCGHTASVIPTAYLSTHTGGFGEVVYSDLSDQFERYVNHWEHIDIKFDFVRLGYIGSSALLERLDSAVKRLSREDTVLLIDPAMADNGKLYERLGKNYIEKMSNLLFCADIIIPNLTEASLLLGEPFEKSAYDEAFSKETVKRLYEKYNAVIILTGISYNDNNIGALLYDGKEYFYTCQNKVPGHFHGTGDLFSSIVISAIASGKSFKDSLEIASKYTSKAIEITANEGIDSRHGIMFEKILSDLANAVK